MPQHECTTLHLIPLQHSAPFHPNPPYPTAPHHTTTFHAVHYRPADGGGARIESRSAEQKSRACLGHDVVILLPSTLVHNGKVHHRPRGRRLFRQIARLKKHLGRRTRARWNTVASATTTTGRNPRRNKLCDHVACARIIRTFIPIPRETSNRGGRGVRIHTHPLAAQQVDYATRLGGGGRWRGGRWIGVAFFRR